MDPFCAQVPPEPEALRPLRHALSSWLRCAQVPEALHHSALLAVNEATANAIEHARPAEPVHVTVTVDGADLVAEVRDGGQWQPPVPGSVRGRGLAIIAVLVDDLRIHRGPGGTEVRMVAHLPPMTDLPVSRDGRGSAVHGPSEWR